MAQFAERKPELPRAWQHARRSENKIIGVCFTWRLFSDKQQYVLSSVPGSLFVITAAGLLLFAQYLRSWLNTIIRMNACTYIFYLQYCLQFFCDCLGDFIILSLSIVTDAPQINTCKERPHKECLCFAVMHFLHFVHIGKWFACYFSQFLVIWCLILA